MDCQTVLKTGSAKWKYGKRLRSGKIEKERKSSQKTVIIAICKLKA